MKKVCGFAGVNALADAIALGKTPGYVLMTATGANRHGHQSSSNIALTDEQARDLSAQLLLVLGSE